MLKANSPGCPCCDTCDFAWNLSTTYVTEVSGTWTRAAGTSRLRDAKRYMHTGRTNMDTLSVGTGKISTASTSAVLTIDPSANQWGHWFIGQVTTTGAAILDIDLIDAASATHWWRFRLDMSSETTGTLTIYENIGETLTQIEGPFATRYNADTPVGALEEVGYPTNAFELFGYLGYSSESGVDVPHIEFRNTVWWNYDSQNGAASETEYGDYHLLATLDAPQVSGGQTYPFTVASIKITVTNPDENTVTLEDFMGGNTRKGQSDICWSATCKQDEWDGYDSGQGWHRQFDEDGAAAGGFLPWWDDLSAGDWTVGGDVTDDWHMTHASAGHVETDDSLILLNYWFPPGIQRTFEFGFVVRDDITYKVFFWYIDASNYYYISYKQISAGAYTLALHAVVATVDTTLSSSYVSGDTTNLLVRLTLGPTWLTGNLRKDDSTLGTLVDTFDWSGIAEPSEPWQVGFAVDGDGSADDDFEHVYARCDSVATSCICAGGVPNFPSTEAQVIIAGMDGDCATVNGTYALTRDLIRQGTYSSASKANCSWSYTSGTTIIRAIAAGNVATTLEVEAYYKAGTVSSLSRWFAAAPGINCDPIDETLTGAARKYGAACAANSEATAAVTSV